MNKQKKKIKKGFLKNQDKFNKNLSIIKLKNSKSNLDMK